MKYIVQPGDTLQSIAEKHGHSGEWMVLAELNEMADHIPDTRPNVWTIYPDLELPDEWAAADPDTMQPTGELNTTGQQLGEDGLPIDPAVLERQEQERQERQEQPSPLEPSPLEVGPDA